MQVEGAIVQELDGQFVVTPSDLNDFLGCRHATLLNLGFVRSVVPRPSPAADDMLQTLADRGDRHEADYLNVLRARGGTVVEIGRPGPGRDALRAAEDATAAAMADGADAIYQATFFDGRWRGHADFLLRREDRPGTWAWSYDVADTKLARRMKVPALFQMAGYADRLTQLQGCAPERLIVVSGNGQELSYPFADCASYAARARRQLLEFLEVAQTDLMNVAEIVPEPVEQCTGCRWNERCTTQRRNADDLSLVAFMRRDHAHALRAAGVSTVQALAHTSAAALPTSIGEPSRIRLVAQARLQVQERVTGDGCYQILPGEPGRGFALLPAPSSGDLFFDIEGDPLLGEHGLEYLFGIMDGDDFTPYWGTDPSEEKQAFEGCVDHIMQAWDHSPDMHVFHYASYEPTRLKSLAGRHGTREAEVDRLLRGHRLVDLYAVVRQAIQISKESYSLKKVEEFYWARAAEGVTDAGSSVVAFEQWLETHDQGLLESIASYNEDDCRSTQQLRDWLEDLRGEAGGDPVYRRPEVSDGDASDAVVAVQGDIERLSSALLHGVPAEGADGDHEAQRVLAALLEWHVRESRPEWWEYYARLELSDEELVEDAASVGQLSAPTRSGSEARSTLWRMEFPQQETKVTRRDKVYDPRTRALVGTVTDINSAEGWLILKRGTGVPVCASLIPAEPIPPGPQADRLRELAEWVLEHGMSSSLPDWRAARDLLARTSPTRTPRASLIMPGEAPSEAVTRLAQEFDRGFLAVQGPPGTGKTRSAAIMISDLLASGRRVGITAHSHRVIGNLLDAVCDQLANRGMTVSALQKADDHQRCRSLQVRNTNKPKDIENALASGIQLVAGTTWLYSRPGLSEQLDVLVVDEAGQLSLANVLAASHAAKRIVMLGDPQQLAQPRKGRHPAGAEASALEHVIAGHATMPRDRGVLLDVTWRMHPEVAGFISRTFYDGLLTVAAGCERQRVGSSSLLGGTGLRMVPVHHIDNSASSSEEADAVLQLCTDVLSDGTWTDSTGATRKLLPSDILVVAAYNAQVNRLTVTLGELVTVGLRVGTVDIFQGQEAPIVIYSMASSTAEDAPRGIDFLYDGNRLNVAISRARAVAAVVGSPLLLSANPRTTKQLRLVNALCGVADQAEVQVSDGDHAPR